MKREHKLELRLERTMNPCLFCKHTDVPINKKPCKGCKCNNGTQDNSELVKENFYK